uniref:Uncharacterized protein n=1 Tax=Poecilia reticulata TaxID=8081 RepID=A0A3P9P1U8_POERE
MCTRGLKVSCRYNASGRSALTSPRLDLMLLQLIDLHLDTHTPERHTWKKHTETAAMMQGRGSQRFREVEGSEVK